MVPKLVIWPETAFAGFTSRSQSLLNTTIRNATQNDGVVITGIPRFGGGRTLLNSAIMINHDGAIQAIYDKRHLVPFGEYMPFANGFHSSSRLLARLILCLVKIIA